MDRKDEGDIVSRLDELSQNRQVGTHDRSEALAAMGCQDESAETGCLFEGFAEGFAVRAVEDSAKRINHRVAGDEDGFIGNALGQ